MNRAIIFLLIPLIAPAAYSAEKASSEDRAIASDRLEGIFAFNKGDYKTAFKKLEPQANTADAYIQNIVGVMHEGGQGVKQNYTQAVKWYQKASDQGDNTAQNNLGTMYAKGLGVEKDYQQAVKWYQKAAEQGNSDAQYNLGLTYYFGSDTIKKDYHQANKWFQKAAKQGNANAQYRLGVNYYNVLVLGKTWLPQKNGTGKRVIMVTMMVAKNSVI